MNIHIIGMTSEFIGTLLIAITALLVHERVRKEHKIDDKVLVQIKLEKSAAYLGIVLLISGFVLQIMP